MADTEIRVGRSLLSGGAWMIALRWAIRGVGLFSTFILARLLAPGDFGLIAMALTVIGLVEVLGMAGQKLSLVRHPNPTRAHYDSVWTLSILVAIGLTLVIWIIAWPAALYFHDARVSWLIRILALKTLIGGFENIGVVNFGRDLRFDRVFVYAFVQRIINTVTTILLALWLRDWRALAASALIARLLGVALSYVVHPYRPRLCVSHIREVLAFSGWMLTVNVSQYLNDRADELAVGGLGQPAAMGIYNVAADVATSPTAETVLPATAALFPVFARIRDDAKAMRAAYLDVLSVTCILSVAIGGGMALVAGDFVTLVLGSKWLGAIPLVRVLAIAGGLYAIMQNGIPALTATGNERLAAQLTTTRAILTLISVGAAAAFGDIMTIAVARVVVTLLFIPGIFLTVARVLPITLGDMLERLWRPLVAGAVMAVCVLAAQATAPDLPAIRLPIDVATGAIAYTGATLLLWILAGHPEGLEAKVIHWIGSRPALQRLRAS